MGGKEQLVTGKAGTRFFLATSQQFSLELDTSGEDAWVARVGAFEVCSLPHFSLSVVVVVVVVVIVVVVVKPTNKQKNSPFLLNNL